MGNKQIGEYGKKYRWKKGQSGNPNGQPKKTISYVNDELLKEGYQPARQTDVINAYMQLVGLDKAKLKEIYEKEDIPVLFRIVARALLNGQKTFDVLEKILDRGIGKPIQQIEGDFTQKHEGKIIMEFIESPYANLDEAGNPIQPKEEPKEKKVKKKAKKKVNKNNLSANKDN